MKKLYSHCKLFFLVLLCSPGAAHSMELPITQQQPRKISSLADQCTQFIAHNTKEVNLINNLANLPDELALNTLISRDNCTYNMDVFFFDENYDALKKLVLSDTLGMNTACALAYKLRSIRGDSKLTPLKKHIYELAKNGKLESSLASIILKEKIFKKTYDYAYEAVDANMFSLNDFKQQCSFEEIDTITNPFVLSGLIEDFSDCDVYTLSRCKQFFAVARYAGIDIYNLKTESKIKLAFNYDELTHNRPQKLVFNNDCSKLGILTMRNQIFCIEVFTALSDNKLFFEYLRPFLHCMEQLKNKTHCEPKCAFSPQLKPQYLQHMLLENENSQENALLAKYITENILNQKIYPLPVLQELSRQLSAFTFAINWLTAVDIVAKELNITRKEVLKELSNCQKIIKDDGSYGNEFAEKFSTILIKLNPELHVATVRASDCRIFSLILKLLIDRYL